MKEHERKKVFGLLLAVFLLTLLPCIFGNSSMAANEEYTYGVNDNGDATITGYSGTDSVVVIPATIGGHKVVSIGDSAFKGCTTIQDLTIPDSVTTIGLDAFSECTGLSSVKLSKGLTSMRAGAFRNCDGITSIEIPKSLVDSPRANSFNDSDRDGAFNGCDNLKTVAFEEGITVIADHLFAYCPGLEEITIPGTVSVIEYHAFCHSSIGKITLKSGLESIEEGAFWGCGNLNEIVIPDSVTTIGLDAFSECTGLSSVKLSKGLTSMRAGAFRNCDGITSIEIPKSLVDSPRANSFNDSDRDGAFNGCDNLKTVAFEEGITVIADHLFAYCPGLEEITIPGTVTVIEYHAFCHSSIGKITLKSGLESIEEGAFWGCGNLNEIVIPDSVTTIGLDAFSECTGLSSVKLSKGLISMRAGAFRNCDGITSIEIPKSLVDSPRANSFNDSDRDGAFNDCDGLKNVIFEEGTTVVADHLFAFCYGLTEITIPSSVTTIEHDAFKQSGIKKIHLQEGLQILEDGAFYECESLEKIILPDSVTTIGLDAFQDCTNLSFVRLPKNLVSMRSGAFRNCDKITSIEIPKSLKDVPTARDYGYDSDRDGAFNDCDSLKNVIFEEGTTVVADHLFAFCYGLTEITIPSSVTTIEHDAFKQSGIKKIHLQEGLQTLEDGAFYKCGSLEEIILPDSVTTIGLDVFQDCTNLSGVRLSKNLESMRSGAFRNCDKITSIEIPKSLKDVPTARDYGYDSERDGVFNGCDGLKSITFEEGISAIPNYLFAYCPGLEEVFLPDSIKTIGKSAFKNCTNLSNILFSTNLSTIAKSAFMYDTKIEKIRLYQKVTSIGSDAFKGIPNLTIECPQDSYAMKYAKMNGYSIVEFSKSTQNSVSYEAKNRSNVKSDSWVITVYASKNSNSSMKNETKVCENAEVSVDGITYKTNKHGVVEIPKFSDFYRGSIEVKKEGYCTRELSYELARENAKIYLQPIADKGPVVNSVWIGTLDVMNQNYQTSLHSDRYISMKGDIDWGEDGFGELWLEQDSKKAYFNHVFAFGQNDEYVLNIRLKDKFDIREKIYIVACDGAGNITKKPLKFCLIEKTTDANGALHDPLNGLNIKLGNNLSITLPEDMEPGFMAGQTISLDFLSTIIPVTYSAENGVIRILWGVDFSKCKYNNNKWNEEAEEYARELKNTGLFGQDREKLWTHGYDVNKKINDFKKSHMESLTSGRKNYVVEAKVTVFGYMEGSYDAKGNISWRDEGGIIISPEISASRSWYLMAGPIPLSLDVKLTGKADCQVPLRTKGAVTNFVPIGSADAEIALDGSVTAGVKKVLYASGGLEGKLKPQLRFYLNDPAYFKLSASLDAYVKAGVLFFEYKHKWTLYDEVWYETSRGYAAAPKNLLSPGEMYNTGNYVRKNLSYLDEGSSFDGWSEDGLERNYLAGAPNAEYLERRVLKTNIYRESTPQYAYLGEGKLLAVWLDAEANDVNGIQLYYSYFDGTQWGEPTPVQADGTIDGSPCLLVDGDAAYLAWQNATRAFGDEEGIDDIAAYFDISVGRFNPENGFEVVTLESEGLDMMPVLCGGGDDLYVAWVNNGANAWFGDNQQNVILYVKCEDGTWGSPVRAYEGLNSIDCLAADYDGGLKLAYVMDADGNVDDGSDAFLYENGARVTASETAERSPAYFGHVLYWQTEGGLQTRNDAWDLSWAGSDCQFLTVGGDRAVIYTKQDGMRNILSVSFLNGETEKWCEPYELTDNAGFIGAFASLTTEDGGISVLYNSQEVNEDEEDPYGAARLMLVTLKPYGDFAIGEVSYRAEEYNPGGEMAFVIEATNNGSIAVDGLVLTISDENGGVLSSRTEERRIMPGETVEAVAIFRVPENACGQTVKLSVAGAGVNDLDFSDNEVCVELGYEDVGLENPGAGVMQNGNLSLTAEVVNRGYSARSGITVSLRREAPDGEVVSTASVESLNPMELRAVSFEVSRNDCDVYCFTLEGVNDEFPANDEVLLNLSELKSEETSDKAEPEYTAPVARKGLIYDGTAKKLITPGTATGGTMAYAVTTGDDEPSAGDYAETVPEATEKGTYHVYYMVFGDESHEDVVASFVTVEIEPVKHTVTFAANGGEGIMESVRWEKGTEFTLPECEFTAPKETEFDGWEVDGTVYDAWDDFTVNKDVTVKARWKKLPFKLAGANMNLGNALAMNFYINKSDIDTSKEYYVEIRKDYVGGTTAVRRIPMSKWSSYNDKLYKVVFNGIAAKEMNDRITVQVFEKDGTAVSQLWVDSVVDYVKRALDKQQPYVQTAMVDMLNYGAAAQKALKYDEDNLANSWLSDAQKAYASEAATGTNAQKKIKNYQGCNLNLGSNLCMNMYFTTLDPEKYNTMYAVLTYTNHNGKECSIRVDGSRFMKYSDTLTNVRVEVLAVAEVNSAVECKVYSKNGNALLGHGIDSIGGYIARQTQTNEVFDAIMRFSKSAYKCFHPNTN